MNRLPYDLIRNLRNQWRVTRRYFTERATALVCRVYRYLCKAEGRIVTLNCRLIYTFIRGTSLPVSWFTLRISDSKHLHSSATTCCSIRSNCVLSDIVLLFASGFTVFIIIVGLRRIRNQDNYDNGYHKIVLCLKYFD